MALGWLLAAGFLQAEAPMDLDSPFVQTVLIQEKNGEITEKAVRKGKINGGVLELEKEEGGLLVLPRVQVIALLPRFPQAGTVYLQSDAQRALKILEAYQVKFPQRPEVDANTIAEWRKLGSAKTEHDQVRSTALDEWLKRSSQISSETPPEQLEKMKEEGAEFLTQFPERGNEIGRELRGLKELSGIDLKKIDAVQFELGPLGENIMPGLVLWALLFIPLVLALKAFPDALQGFREGVPLAGGLRLLIGVAVLTLVTLILLSAKEGGAKEMSQEDAASAAARKAGWFSINHQEKWSNQGAKKIPLPASDWLAFLKEKTLVGSGADSFPFWHLAKPRMYKTDSSLMVLQSVQAKFITLPFRFNFNFPKTGQSLADLELRGVSIGKIPLGASFGQLVWNLFRPSYQSFVETCGLNQGVRWLAGEGMTMVIEIPQTKKPTPVARDSLSAKDLAEVFDQGYGEIYLGRVITVEGALISVSSRRETLGAGTGLAVADPIDEFVLQGIPQGPSHRFGLHVRCQFRSSDTCSLDTKGDLFVSKNARATDTYSLGANEDLPKPKDTPQDPFAGIPVLRRQQGITLVRMSAGRVESGPDEKRAVTLYDCRKAEGFEGGAWKTIWESETQPRH